MRRWWQRLLVWLGQLLRPLSLGQRGERIAARHLRRQGWTILHRRYRLPGGGELDLVVTDGRQIVFVEVKSRLGASPQEAMENVHAEKRRRLIQAAATYLKYHGLHGYPVRFDVVSVTWPRPDAPPQVVHVPDAFRAPAWL